MKKVLFIPFLILLIPQTVFADVHVTATGDSNVSVNQQTQGESTTCINGDCTTIGGGSHSKVCVNGDCTQTDGDLDIDKGNAQIHIKSSTSSSTTSQNNSKTEVNVKTSTNSGEEKEASDEVKSRSAGESILQKITNLLKQIFSFL